MIDVETEVTCRVCGKPIKRVPGRRPRVYCRSSCRQKALRERKREQVAAQRSAETSYLQAFLDVQAANLKLQLEVDRLQKLIGQAADIEEAFNADTSVHSFKKWLKAHQYHAQRPGCEKILDDAYGFPPAGSRGTYTDAMSKAYFGLDDKNDVWAAWRDMLRDELFKSYYANRDRKED